MKSNTLEIVNQFQSCHGHEQIRLESFAEELKTFFGHDGWELTVEQIEIALSGPVNVPSWGELFWAGGETIVSLYDDDEHELSEWRLVLAAMCLMAEAVHRCDCDWEHGGHLMVVLFVAHRFVKEVHYGPGTELCDFLFGRTHKASADGD